MGEIVFLRALETSDLDRCLRWHNDRSLYEALGGTFHFVSRKAAQAWIEQKSAFMTDQINLAICVKGSGVHVGNIYLHEVDWVVRRARLEVFIGERGERTKGYGQSAIRQMIAYAFNDLGMKKVYLDVLTDNEVAIHIYEKLGFELEGMLRSHVFKQGHWKDMLLMGIYADELSKEHRNERQLEVVTKAEKETGAVT